MDILIDRTWFYSYERYFVMAINIEIDLQHGR